MASDPTIQRQYIGTYSGLTRIFPGFLHLFAKRFLNLFSWNLGFEWDVAPKEYSIDLFGIYIFLLVIYLQYSIDLFIINS